MLKKVFLLFLGVALFYSCQSARPIKRLTNDSIMYAMIYDFDNTPVNAVSVYINGRMVVDSDIQGRFILDNMRTGEYTVRLEKRGYELLEETFYFDPMQVLYFKMINTSQLVALAETALENSEFSAAEVYINRALVLEPGRPDILYLKSIACYLQGRNAEAADILENLIRSGNTNNAIIQLLEIIRQRQE